MPLLEKCMCKYAVSRAGGQGELVTILKSLKDSACGSDELSPKIIKMSMNVITDPLLHVCNMSLLGGIFPSELKTAKVVPIFKSGDIMKFTNYRPVSVLPVLSKVLERLVYNRLLKFIDKYKFFIYINLDSVRNTLLLWLYRRL